MLIRPILQPGLRTYSDPDQPDKERFCAHLASQLVARLVNDSRRFAITGMLIEHIKEHATRPWLGPLVSCMEAPVTDIAMAVSIAADASASAVGISQDRSLLITGGEDHVKSKDRNSSQIQPGTENYTVRA